MEKITRHLGYQVAASSVERLQGEYPNPINERPDFNAMFDELISKIEHQCNGREYIIYEWRVVSTFAPCNWDFPHQAIIHWGYKGDNIPDKYKFQ